MCNFIMNLKDNLLISVSADHGNGQESNLPVCVMDFGNHGYKHGRGRTGDFPDSPETDSELSQEWSLLRVF